MCIRDSHLLGYGIDHHHPDLNAALDGVRTAREERNRKIISRLNELGFSITLRDVMKWCRSGTLGRGHIAQALVAAGFMDSVEEAFERLLTKDGPAYVDRRRLAIEDAVRLIHRCGGVAVWAHPGLHGSRLESLLESLPDWVALGLDGLESDYSLHTIELSRRLRRIAEEYGLIFTGGSDFHGVLKPDIRLGEGPEGNPIDADRLTALDERLREVRRALREEPLRPASIRYPAK